MVDLKFSRLECFSSVLSQPHRFGSVQGDSQESVAVTSRVGAKQTENPESHSTLHGKDMPMLAIQQPSYSST